VVVVLLFFFTNWFVGIVDSLLWLILGVIFLPTTLFWYTALVRRPVDALAYRGHRGRTRNRRLAGRKVSQGVESRLAVWMHVSLGNEGVLNHSQVKSC
jgi:hypothetical protein